MRELFFRGWRTTFWVGGLRSMLRFTRPMDGAQSAPQASAVPFLASQLICDGPIEFTLSCAQSTSAGINERFA
ncbi:MAG: hypothetical protein MUP90_01625, partial [Gammaproteobacteria bacterium]|nr:hypothetical protein [Gammaproteobacteria bacterium]